MAMSQWDAIGVSRHLDLLIALRKQMFVLFHWMCEQLATLDPTIPHVLQKLAQTEGQDVRLTLAVHAV